MKQATIKVSLLAAMIVAWLTCGIAFKALANAGVLDMAAPELSETPGNDSVVFGTDTNLALNADAAKSFLESNMVRDDGHVSLYFAPQSSHQDLATNSEAISYYLLWNAIDKDRETFDHTLSFMERKMLSPQGYMMWRIEEDGTVREGGQNIASDADLRAIKALLIAENLWGEKRYTKMIETLSSGLESVAITKDKLLAPYGGFSGENSTWTSSEVWLSYSDFPVMQELAKRRGQPWKQVYSKMKEAALGAQIYNGLYNSELTQGRLYGNGIDSGAYSINSLWMMVRGAESSDAELRESSEKSLAFYKLQFSRHGALYESYLSTGEPARTSESPWVYALVGRTAINLRDWNFSRDMERKLLSFQVMDANSTLYGAFPEGEDTSLRVGQFTMQETILTLQDYLKNKHEYELYLALNGEKFNTSIEG